MRWRISDPGLVVENRVKLDSQGVVEPIEKPGGSSRFRSRSCSEETCKVRERYRIGRVIGHGAFSCVRLAVDRVTGQEWACKILRMPRPGDEPDVGESSLSEVVNEVQVLKSIGKHPSLVHLREYFVERDKVYIILELVHGGELLYAVADRGSLAEEDAREIMRTVLEGIAHMHSAGLAHRDLKLENLLIVDPDCISRVKIADFGLSKKTSSKAMATVCGTPMYVSPEALNVIDRLADGYGPECDLWACGILMFILLGGYPPFMDKDGNTTGGTSLFKKIQTGSFDFQDPVWELVSEEAKDLIMQLLKTDPSQRATAQQALRHPWCAT